MAARVLQHPQAKPAKVTEQHIPCDACGSIPRRKYWLNHRLRYPIKYLLKNASYRARLRNLEFNLTEEDIEIPDVCPVLGIPLFLIRECTGKYCNWNAPSLDRIDNRKGYTKDNIRIISWRANQLKRDMTFEEAKLIYNDAININNRTAYPM